MKQKLLNKLWLRVGMIVAIMTTALSGTAWAEDAYYTLDTTGDLRTGNSTYASTGTATSDGIEWAFTGNGTLNPWRLGGKSLSKAERLVYTKTAMGAAIDKVNLTVGAASSITVNSLSLVVASDASFNTIIDEADATFSANSTITFEPNRVDNWTKNAYYKFVFKVTVSGTSNKFVEFNKVEFFEVDTTPAYTITAQSNDDSYGTVSLNGSVITATPATGYTYADPAYTVSPANSATVAQEGNEFTVTPTANTAVTINFEAIPTYTVSLGDNSSTLTEVSGGAGVELPSRNAVGDYTFAGWSETEVTTETTTAPTIIPAGVYNPTGDITLYPVYTRTEGGGTVNNTASVTISDYATANSWINSTQYSNVSLDANVTASAAGGGNTGKYYTNGNEWRFYQNESPTLTISTSNGTLTSITITYNISNTGILEFNNSNITSGTTVNVSGTSAEFTVGNTGNATNGQVKITAIEVNYSASGSTTYYWSSPVAAAVEQPVIAVAENPFLFSTTATITCETDGATIYYTLDGNDPTPSSSVYSTAITLTATTTIKALAVVGSDESTVASVTATKNLATPTVTVSGDLTDDLAGETNVNAGTLTAAVTYNTAAVAGATVTWESSDTDVATIDASTGAVTLLTTGEVTFTATYAGNGDYASATGTKTITVVDNDPNAITIWSEDFSSYNADDVPSGGKYGYSCGGTGTKIYDAVLAGGTTPELLVAKNGGTFTAVVPLNNATGDLTLTYKTNAKAMSVSTTTDGITGDGSFNTAGEHTIIFSDVTTAMTSITIVFTATSSSDNVRLDDIMLTGHAEPVSVEAPTFSVNGGTYYTTQSVELSCETDGATIYYTTNGDEPTSSSTEYTGAITVSETMTIKAIAIKGSDQSTVSSATYTIAEKNDVVFSITDKSIAYGETYTVTKGSYTGRDIQTDGTVTVSTDNAAVASVSEMTITAEAVGTATITLTAAEGDTYKAGSTTITITVTAPTGQTKAPAVPALFNETFDKCDGSGGRDGVYTGNVGTSTTADKLDEKWATIGNNGANGCIKLGTGSAAGTVTTSNIALTGNGTLTFSAAGWGDTGTNWITVSATGATLSGDTEITLSNGEWNGYTFNITEATGAVAITFSMKRGFLDDVKVVEEGAAADPITAKLNTYGYATFCSQYPLDFSDYATAGYSAWQITGVSGETITFSQITGRVKGGTGILLKGTAGEPITLTSADSEITLSGNKLYGTLAPTYVAADTYYGLSGNEFVKVNAGTVPAGKALLPASALSSSVKAFTFVFEDDATGINEELRMKNEESSIYKQGSTIVNLAGQMVNGKSVNGKLPKGIYIVNGKKVMVK